MRTCTSAAEHGAAMRLPRVVNCFLRFVRAKRTKSGKDILRGRPLVFTTTAACGGACETGCGSGLGLRPGRALSFETNAAAAALELACVVAVAVRGCVVAAFHSTTAPIHASICISIEPTRVPPWQSLMPYLAATAVFVRSQHTMEYSSSVKRTRCVPTGAPTLRLLLLSVAISAEPNGCWNQHFGRDANGCDWPTADQRL